jgi:hypothetical protein
MIHKRLVRHALLLTSLLALIVQRGLAGDSPKSSSVDPTDAYVVKQVEGWNVSVNERFLHDQPELAKRTLTLLGHQLYQVTRAVPAGALEKLRTIRIWVEENEPHHPCMTYHPDAGWLREHGMSTKKARCVEVANARNFLAWTRNQPWMVLHELAHGYHHQFLDGAFQNAEIKAVFDRAMTAKLYDSVLHFDGEQVQGYAATNPMEYFAEASEAYFGTNDFYPFVRSELRQHDPAAFTLLEKLWERP